MPGTWQWASGELALIASRVRFEERALLEAMEARGIHVSHADPRHLSVAAGGWAEGPRLALNREIGWHRARYTAAALESAGVTVCNGASATRLCGDKWDTSMALAAAGLPTPRTVLAMSGAAASRAIEEIGFPAVIKPVVGSWGRLVCRVGDAEAAATVFEYSEALPSPQSHLIYLQEEIVGTGRDIRAIVIGGEVVGATYRHGTQWRTNVARGAVSVRMAVTPEVQKYAAAAAAAVGADVAGVDLLESTDGAAYVLEVNDRVEFRGFQEAHDRRVDVAGRIADFLKGKLHE